MEIINLENAIPGQLYITANSGLVLYCGPVKSVIDNEHIFYSYLHKTILKYRRNGECWSNEDSTDDTIIQLYNPDVNELARSSKDPESFKAGYEKALSIYETLAGK